MRFPPLAILLLSLPAIANPRALPFTYPYETLPQGELELEQFVDVTPVESVNAAEEHAWSANFRLISEIEYGLTDKLELGLYFQFISEPGEAPLIFDGIKQRLRYRLAEQGEWPVDVSIYGEIAEMFDELELELKLNLQRRIGPARLMVNLWGEREFHYDGTGAWVLNPTGGVTFQIAPWLHLGAEYWMRAELGEFTHHFLGPAVSIQFRKLWWTTAAYLRLDGLGGAIAPGDAFGRIWVRTVIGLNL
jgi:hypothetical protein